VEKRTQVVVYGSSLNMATVTASLNADQGLEVISVDPRSPTARQYLRELNPAVIAFDLNDPPQTMEAILLRERPEVLLIGVDPTNEEILVLSSRPQQVHSASDLIGVIQEYSQSVQ
jgi:chemotaxis response regulator CheB